VRPLIAAVVAAPVLDTPIAVVVDGVPALALWAFLINALTVGILAAGDGRERLVGHGDLSVLGERDQLLGAAARTGPLL